jgi:hypothetical protein
MGITMKIACLLPLLVFLVSGCSSRKKSPPSFYDYEVSLADAQISLQALEALANGNTERAVYLLQINVFNTTGSLPILEKEDSIPEPMRQKGRRFAEDVLGYMERNVDTIDPDLAMVRRCTVGLEGLLDSPAQLARCQRFQTLLRDRRERSTQSSVHQAKPGVPLETQPTPAEGGAGGIPAGQ